MAGAISSSSQNSTAPVGLWSAPPAYSEVIGHDAVQRTCNDARASHIKSSLLRRSKRRTANEVLLREDGQPMEMSSQGRALLPNISRLPHKDINFALTVSDNFCFVYPNAYDEVAHGEDEAESSTSAQQKAFFVVQVTVALAESYSSSLRTIQSLEVQLRAKQTLTTSEGFYEYNDVAISSIQLADATSFELIAGSMQTFEALVEVPATAAPYDMQNCASHAPYIQAKLKLGSAVTSPIAQHDSLKATSWLERTMASLPRSRTLTAKEDVYIIAVPRSDSRLEYSRTHRTAVDNLGPISAHARTESLTVGSYIRLGLALPAISPGTVIGKIEWSIIQDTTIQSKRTSVMKFAQASRLNLITVSEADALEALLSPLKEAESGRNDIEGHSLLGTWLARLPSDDVLRPTTLEGSTDAGIRVSHQLELRVTFQDAQSVKKSGVGKDRAVFCVKWPLTIASCLCRAQSIVLPSYSAKDPCAMGDATTTMASVVAQRATVVREWRRNNAPLESVHLFCNCGSTMDEILRHETDADAVYTRRAAESIMLSELLPNTESAQTDREDGSQSDSLSLSMTQREQQEQASRIAEKARQSYHEQEQE